MNAPDSADQYIILGTAGHIDHGKTALVKALTGIDTDRLKEEKRRGITIELGFAYMDLDSTIRAAIIDVPGHERFVRHMLAGASGIDYVMLVIAADEGIMPQTREHLQICQLMGIERGCVVMTKSDLVDEDWMTLVEDEIQLFLKDTFLADAAIIRVSAKTGEGIPFLRDHLRSQASTVGDRNAQRPFRLYADRVFSKKGFGTIVTGTIVSGRTNVGRSVQTMPGGDIVRIRSLQVHHETVDTAKAGQRAAINLQGIERSSLDRGMVLAEPDSFTSTLMVTVMLHVLPDCPFTIKPRTRVRFHVGTLEVLARVIPLDKPELRPGEDSITQLRLESPVIAVYGDHFVIRSYSPLMTIGGGSILDPIPAKINTLSPEQVNEYRSLEHNGLSELVSFYIHQAGLSGISLRTLCIKTGLFDAELGTIAEQLISEKKIAALEKGLIRLVSLDSLETLKKFVRERIAAFHDTNRLRPGITRDELVSQIPFLPREALETVCSWCLEEGSIQQQGDYIALSGRKIATTNEEQRLRESVMAMILKQGMQALSIAEVVENTGVPSRKVRPVLDMLLKTEELVFVKPHFLFLPDVLQNIVDTVTDYLKKQGKLEVSDMKSLFNFTRKHAIPILEYLDAQAITSRKENYRILKP